VGEDVDAQHVRIRLEQVAPEGRMGALDQRDLLTQGWGWG